MPDDRYNWERFWCKRDGYYESDSDGYPVPPDSSPGSTTSAVPFEIIAQSPCLVLLGEPGIGKSYTLRDAFELEKSLAKPEDVTLFFDLRSFGSEDRLVRHIFESEAIRLWSVGEGNLSLFLDSLDEALLRVQVLASLIPDQLENLPLDRVKIRVSCRTADLPPLLELRLTELFGKEKVGVYELLPLTRESVRAAALASRINADDFLGDVNRKGVVSIAFKPVTLRFLLRSYRESGTLPASRAEVFNSGLRILAEESNESRRGSRLIGALDVDRRLEVASRIAAITMIGNRFAVFTGTESDELPQEDVSVRELIGGYETAAGSTFEVDTGAVLETLGTGLFSARGAQRLSWAHQTYGEYLAAQYLVRHNVPLVQILSLLVNSSDPERKVIPQLQEVAGWLGSTRSDVFAAVVENDPETLLRSDMATAEESQRKSLLISLLHQYAAGKLVDRDAAVRRLYHRLNYSGITEDLYTYILDPFSNPIVRRVAIEIAAECGVTELEQAILGVALDVNAPITVRAHAIEALTKVGTAESKERLLPIARGESGDDPDDELKGHALIAVWPELLSAKDLFATLTPPKRENLLGVYKYFLHGWISRHLLHDDLVLALEWIAHTRTRGREDVGLGDLVDQIMVRGWKHLQEPQVFDAFVPALISRLRNHEHIMGANVLQEEELRLNSNVRRSLAEAVMGKLHRGEAILLYWRSHLIQPSDLDWLLGRLSSLSGTAEAIAANLIARMFDIDNAEQVSAVLTAAESSGVLRGELAIEPVQLGSHEAVRLQEIYQERLEWEERAARTPTFLNPPPHERVEASLQKAEKGDLDAWWRLVLELGLKPDSSRYDGEYEPNLTDLHGWQSTSEDAKSRITTAAGNYILEREPRPKRWLGKNTSYRPDDAGYKALRLLLITNPEFIRDLDSRTWAKWAWTILGFETWSTGDTEEVRAQKTLACSAYAAASVNVIAALRDVIQSDLKKRGHTDAYEHLEGCWTRDLTAVLLERMARKTTQISVFYEMMAFLFEHDRGAAESLAWSIIGRDLNKPATGKRAVAAASLLIEHSDSRSWPEVWHAVTQRTAFAKEVITRLATSRPRTAGSYFNRLAEFQVAELFVFVYKHWPQQEELSHFGVRNVTVLDEIIWFRDSALRHLQERGTFEAGSSIEHIRTQLPQLEWLKWTIQSSYANARRQSWRPPSPKYILELALNREKRLLQNGGDLLDVLIESLERLELRLQGVTPQAFALWNEVVPEEASRNVKGTRRQKKDAVFRPKEEGRLSDFVKAHLEYDLRDSGIILNREVEIRTGAGAVPGEETDIQVDAVLHTGSAVVDVLTVIIEVKGCWNPDLLTSMESQLANRYLKDNNLCDHGLYLVGWYNCPQWDRKDYRCQRAPKGVIADLAQTLVTQGQQLTSSERELRVYVLDVSLRN